LRLFYVDNKIDLRLVGPIAQVSALSAPVEIYRRLELSAGTDGCLRNERVP